MADNSFGIKELNLVGSGTPKIQSPNNINLEAVTVAISTNATVGGNLSVSGTLTGDGSGLTGVVGSGSGIAIKHDGAVVGTAGTIDFSTNLDVSAISGAAVTITASSGGIGTDGSINTTGIITASQFHATDKITVGSGATIEANGQANFVGFVTFKNEVEIEGMIIKDGGTANSVYLGQLAGGSLAGGQQNTAVGYWALQSNINGNFNTAVGTQALSSCGSNASSGVGENTAVGHIAGANLDGGGLNTLIGRKAGYLLTTPSANTIIGVFDGNSNGLDIRTSSSNVVIADGNGNIRFYANSSGDVGINSVAPTSKLDVGGSISAADKVIVGSGATIEANGQASFTGIITSKSSILVEGGSLNVDIGNLNQGFWMYNGASAHLGMYWSSSASKNYITGSGSHELMFDDFTHVTIDSPLRVSGSNDFKVGTGVTINPNGQVSFVGVTTIGSSLFVDGTLYLNSGTIRREGKLWINNNGGNPKYYAGTPTSSSGDHIFSTFTATLGDQERFRIGADGQIGLGYLGTPKYGTSGQVLTSGGSGSAASWTTISGGIGTNGSVNTTGIITAASFSGVGNDIVTARWTLGANGTSDFTFTGPGFPTTQNDPVIYLARGQTYEFDLDNTGGSHPFQIQDSEDNPYDLGVTYPSGISTNSATSGIVTFAVPFTASNTLQYKCTAHPSQMGNTIVIYPNLNV